MKGRLQYTSNQVVTTAVTAPTEDNPFYCMNWDPHSGENGSLAIHQQVTSLLLTSPPHFHHHHPHMSAMVDDDGDGDGGEYAGDDEEGEVT